MGRDKGRSWRHQQANQLQITEFNFDFEEEIFYLVSKFIPFDTELLSEQKPSVFSPDAQDARFMFQRGTDPSMQIN